MTRRSKPQLDNKGLIAGVDSYPSENDQLSTLARVDSKVDSFSTSAEKSNADAETQGLITINPEPINPKQVGVDSSLSLSLERGKLSTLAGSADLLTDACVLHHRVNAGMDYLRTNLSDPDRFTRGRLRLERLVLREYGPLLSELVAGTDPDTLTAQRDELAARLERGWMIDKPGADDLFADLVTRYAVLSDALTGNPVTTIMDRIDRAGLTVSPSGELVSGWAY